MAARNSRFQRGFCRPKSLTTLPTLTTRAHGRMAAWRGQRLKHDDYIAYIDYTGARPHGVRIDLKPDDYIDYRPAASGQRPAASAAMVLRASAASARRPAPGSAEAGGQRPAASALALALAAPKRGVAGPSG